MRNLKNSSARPKPISLKWIAGGWLAFSLVGFLDTTYLTIQHYRGAALECGILQGCEAVTGSHYAVIIGIPLALLGAIYYFSILVLTVAYIDTKRRYFLKIVGYSTIVGFLVSALLVYLQVFVIHALCTYCLISALTSTALFVLALISQKLYWSRERSFAGKPRLFAD